MGEIGMKRTVIMIAGLCIAPAAIAASVPPATLMMGTVAATNGTGKSGYRCSANGGQAFFQRGPVVAGTAVPQAVISVPSVGFSILPAGGESYTGVLSLKFTSATGGTVAFDYNQDTVNSVLPSGDTAHFNGYGQVWTPDAATLKVSFNIAFKNCTLPVVGLFHAQP